MNLLLRINCFKSGIYIFEVTSPLFLERGSELLKLENEEKQYIHNLKVQQRRLDVRLKYGVNWDKAKRVFVLPQKGTNNDKNFLYILDIYKSANPKNSIYMEALRLEISRIVAGFDKVGNDMAIFFYCQQEVSFKVSLNLFENRSLSELWIFINKVCRTSE